MFKWVLLTVIAVVVFSLLAYRLFLYAPLYRVDKEDTEVSALKLNQERYLNYIVTTEINGGVTMHLLDSISAGRNYKFTGRNLSKDFINQSAAKL